MLNGIDDVDWSSLDGAYGPCDEAPEILRAIASPDPEVAGEGRYDFHSSIWHQGTVYPVTAEVVPFLVELAATPGVHHRDHLLRTLGGLCDPAEANGPEQPMVRAAVAVHSGPLLPLLGDPDASVRACAAYALAWSGPHTLDALRDRWAAETDPRVRASILLGLALLGDTPVAGDPAPEVRAAAALTAVRAGRRLPVEDLEAVIHADDEDSPWRARESAFGEVFLGVDEATARDLAERVIRSGVPAVRKELAGMIRQRFLRSRSAPGDLLPLARELLADSSPRVRLSAAYAVSAAGEASSSVAGAVLTASRDEDREVARTALSVLIRLGHPGYREAVLAGHQLTLPRGAEPPPFDPEVLELIRRELGRPGAGSAYAAAADPRDDLLTILAGWGPSAGGAVPEIVALLPEMPVPAAGALVAVGAGALPALPALAELAARGDVRAGHAVLRLTGDSGPLVAAAATALAEKPRYFAHDLGLIADAGPAAAVLLPALRPWLTTETDPRHERRYEQVAAARLAWRATGDAELARPVVGAVVRAGFAPAGTAAALLAELGGGEELRPSLEKLLRAELHARPGAARALHGLGVDADELAEPLVAVVASGAGATWDALDALVSVGATAAVPALTALTEKDERVGDDPWADDRLRRRIRAATERLIQR
ncbi:HEAT repeat domain-containing protein [Actinoplanes sp. NPDC051861]|uniref:HEAT repeat domain-containing protein n=1 Tax=Actinoplanes sp. NPDC051861 TaxID=3155170 RepID=UPI00342F0AB2